MVSSGSNFLVAAIFNPVYAVGLCGACEREMAC